MSKNFIDVESGISEILVRLGIEKAVNELESQANLATSWNDDIGNKVREVLHGFVSDFTNSHSNLESELRSELEAKESELEEMTSTTKSKLDNFVDRMKNYDVDPSLYS